MGNEDSNYKRSEDIEWRRTVETRLVSLTSAQKTTDDDLDKIHKQLDELDELLEGDPLRRDDSGLKGDVKELGIALNTLRAIMAPDQLGHGGIKHRLEKVEAALGLRMVTSENRWKVVLAIISATAVITAAAMANLDRIEKLWKSSLSQSKVTVSSKSKRSTAKTTKRRTPTPVRETPSEATDGSYNEEVPDRRSGDGRNSE